MSFIPPTRTSLPMMTAIVAQHLALLHSSKSGNFGTTFLVIFCYSVGLNAPNTSHRRFFFLYSMPLKSPQSSSQYICCPFLASDWTVTQFPPTNVKKSVICYRIRWLFLSTDLFAINTSAWECATWTFPTKHSCSLEIWASTSSKAISKSSANEDGIFPPDDAFFSDFFSLLHKEK